VNRTGRGSDAKARLRRDVPGFPGSGASRARARGRLRAQKTRDDLASVGVFRLADRSASGDVSGVLYGTLQGSGRAVRDPARTLALRIRGALAVRAYPPVVVTDADGRVVGEINSVTRVRTALRDWAACFP